MPHVTAGAHTREHTRRKARGADRTGSPVEHRTVGSLTAAEVVPLHNTRKALALADADYVDFVVRLEVFDQDAVAGLEVAVAGQLELTLELYVLDVGLLQVTCFRFVRL